MRELPSHRRHRGPWPRPRRQPHRSDLTGVGSRFSRVHLVESILEPGRTIAPSYDTFAAILKDGRVITAVKVAETADRVTLGDQEGNLHDLARRDVRELTRQPVSLMPAGLEKQLSEREFLDLVAFLVAQRE